MSNKTKNVFGLVLKAINGNLGDKDKTIIKLLQKLEEKEVQIQCLCSKGSYEVIKDLTIENEILKEKYRLSFDCIQKEKREQRGVWVRLKTYQLKNRYTGVEDKHGQLIKQGDILKTPEGYYCTVIFDILSFAVESPGSFAVDYEKPEFYAKCEIVSNLNKDPNFYEQFEGD